jgi:GntR family transcriptional regulator/MocR family aminotransferase
VVLEDDYDGEFRYDRKPVGALQSLDPERVILIGSVSKSLSPAVRLGWLVLPAALAPAVAEQRHRAEVAEADAASAQATIAQMVESRSWRVTRPLRTATRYAAMARERYRGGR